MSLHGESCVEAALLVSRQRHVKSPLSLCDSAWSMSPRTMPAYSLSGCTLALLVVRSLFIEACAQIFHIEATVLFSEMMGYWTSLRLTVSLAILFELPCVRATTTTSV